MKSTTLEHSMLDKLEHLPIILYDEILGDICVGQGVRYKTRCQFLTGIGLTKPVLHYQEDCEIFCTEDAVYVPRGFQEVEGD